MAQEMHALFPDDTECAAWFDSLEEWARASVGAVVDAGLGIKQLDLRGSGFAQIPHGVFVNFQAFGLTTLHLSYCSTLAVLPESLGQLQTLKTFYLRGCSSLAALPVSLGQLRALTELYLSDCSSLAALPKSLSQLQALTTLDLRGCNNLARESFTRVDLVLKRNTRIRDRIRDGRALRFPMTIDAFKATVLFGSLRPLPTGAGGAGGGASDANDAPPPANVPNVTPVLGAFPDCILSRLNEHGQHFASNAKRLIADYCGVSYKAAEVEWVADIARQVEEEVPGVDEDEGDEDEDGDDEDDDNDDNDDEDDDDEDDDDDEEEVVYCSHPGCDEEHEYADGDFDQHCASCHTWLHRNIGIGIVQHEERGIEFTVCSHCVTEEEYLSGGYTDDEGHLQRLRATPEALVRMADLACARTQIQGIDSGKEFFENRESFKSEYKSTMNAIAKEWNMGDADNFSFLGDHANDVLETRYRTCLIGIQFPD